jgi:hypothetical protein
MKAPWMYENPGWYLAALRRAYAITKAGGKVRFHWCNPELDADGLKHEVRRALHERINLKVPGSTGAGRKWSYEWQLGCTRDARRVHDYTQRRTIHPVNRLETKELQARFQWSYDHEDGLSIRLSPQGAP